MFGWTDGQKDGWMDRWTDRWNPHRLCEEAGI